MIVLFVSDECLARIDGNARYGAYYRCSPTFCLATRILVLPGWETGRWIVQGAAPGCYRDAGQHLIRREFY